MQTSYLMRPLSLCMPRGTLPEPIPVASALHTFFILLIGYCMRHNCHIYIQVHRFVKFQSYQKKILAEKTQKATKRDEERGCATKILKIEKKNFWLTVRLNRF